METLSATTASRTDVKSAVYERRSVRKYLDKPVSRDLLLEIIHAGRMAPSAMNRQPWSFYVVTDKEMISGFSKSIIRASVVEFAKSGIRQMLRTASDLYHAVKGTEFKSKEDPVFHGAPAVIFITVPKEDEWAMVDAGMCAQNMLLAAHSMGLAGCPIGFAKLIERTSDYPKLRIPEQEQVVLAVVIGYPDEFPDSHPRRKNNVFFLHE
jgi:nitroreductase